MNVIRFNDFELDTTLYQLRKRGAVLEVGPRVFDVLYYLIRNRDRLVSKDELIRQVWGVTAMSDSSVPTCIAAIRKALGDDPSEPEFIETHRGRGYRFIGDLETPADGSASQSAVSFQRGSGPNTHRARFIGREAELRTLYAAFEAALTGSTQIVLIAGEPGIGKTRMIEEFAFAVREDGARTVMGRSTEGGGAPAFWPWIQIVRSFIDSPGASPFPESVGPLASSLVQMVPELADQFPSLPPPPSLDAEQARFRLFDAVHALIASAARDHPIVVLLDDLHRADAASLALLQFSARELRDSPVLLLGTYRDTEVGLDPSRANSLSDLARSEAARTLRLEGLSRESVAEFVAEFSPNAGNDDEFAAALHDQTCGNPFFLTQIVHLLAAKEMLEHATQNELKNLNLPDGIRDAVARQLDGLPSDTRRVLAIAAVCGREFEPAIIMDAEERQPSEVVDALAPAIAANLIAEIPGDAGVFRFSHILLRDCVYEKIPIKDRNELHRKIANSIESRHAERIGPRAAELAHHYEHAVPIAGIDLAIKYSLTAAKWADSRLAHEDVPPHYRRALRLLDQRSPSDPLEFGNLLLTLGDAEIKAGNRDAAQETFKEAARIARECDAPELLSRAALGLAPGFFAIEVGVYDPYLVSLLKEALAKIPSGDSPLRARLLARLSTALVWSSSCSNRFELAREALRVAIKSNDPTTIARVLSNYHESLWGPERIIERRTTIARIHDLAVSLDDPETKLTFHLLKATLELEAGRLHDADESMAAYESEARITRQPRYLWYVPLFRGMRALMRGEHALAERSAHELRRIGERANDRNASQSFAVHLAILGWERNQSRTLLPMVDSFVARYPAVTAWKCVRMFLSHELGLREDATRRLFAIADNGFESVRHDPNRLVSLCLLAEVSSALNRDDLSRWLYNELIRDEGHFAVIGFSTGFFGSVSSRLAMLADSLGDWGKAHEHYRSAISDEYRVEANPWIARSQFQLYQAMQKNDPQQSQNESALLLRESTELAKSHGIENLLARARSS